MAVAGGGGAEHAAAIANAVKAAGTLVRVEPAEFRRLLGLQEAPLVVHATGGFFGTTYQYLTSYKGLAFFTKSKEPVELPGTAEIVLADSIWMPGL